MDNDNSIIQAMMELSAQMKEMKADMATGFAELRAEMTSGFAEVKEEISVLKTDIEKLNDKVETIDAKIDVLSLSPITTQADVLRLKRA